MNHPSEDLLIQYAAGGIEEIGEHVELCDSCAGEVAAIRAILEATYPEDENEDRIELESRRIQTERDSAEAAKDRLISVADDELHDHLLRTAAFETAGGVLELLEWLPTVRWNRPERAEIAAGAVVELSERLSGEGASLMQQLRVAGLREYGSAKRALGRYPEALELFSSAASMAESLPIREFEQARIEYERARTHLELGECDEARRYAESASESFLRFGDRRRFNRARYLVAGCLYNEGATERAAAAFESLLDSLAEDGDEVAAAGARASLGQLYVRLNRTADALRLFDQANRTFRERGMTVDRLRSEWGMARARIADADYEWATDELQRIGAQFEDLGLEEEVGLVKLDLYEALLLLDRLDEARAAIRESVATLSGRFSRREQQRAIAYLREISELGEPAPQQVRSVSDYLDVSRFNVHLSFDPAIVPS